MTTAYTGSQIEGFRDRVLISALRMYVRTGMIANRGYTPERMVAAASRITGTTLSRRDCLGALKAMLEHIDNQEVPS